MADPILGVRDLDVKFGMRGGTAHVVRSLSYDLHPGETLGIVGESGSGKSVSTMSLMGLVPQPPARITGQVLFGGENLLKNSEAQWRKVRGNDIAMIFQDPMTSLNPVLTIGRQLTESMELHLGLRPEQARKRAIELLDQVGIGSPDTRLDSYPHQLSGGMRQRVMIAIGLACEPKILIADEPTTALDVTIQAQIVELVNRLQSETGTAVVWITHDLGVIAGIADRVLVMYAGQVVEEAGVDALYDDPRHPYTLGLLGSLPRLGTDRPDELISIPGLPPDPTDLPPGCAFHPRCPFRHDERCAHTNPQLRAVATGHAVRTFYDVDRHGSPEKQQRGGAHNG